MGRKGTKFTANIHVLLRWGQPCGDLKNLYLFTISRNGELARRGDLVVIKEIKFALLPIFYFSYLNQQPPKKVLAVLLDRSG